MTEKENFRKSSDSLSDYDNIGNHELMIGYRKLQHLSAKGLFNWPILANLVIMGFLEI